MRLALIEPRLFANFIWIGISILSEKGEALFVIYSFDFPSAVISETTKQ